MQAGIAARRRFRCSTFGRDINYAGGYVIRMSLFTCVCTREREDALPRHVQFAIAIEIQVGENYSTVSGSRVYGWMVSSLMLVLDADLHVGMDMDMDVDVDRGKSDR